MSYVNWDNKNDYDDFWSFLDRQDEIRLRMIDEDSQLSANEILDAFEEEESLFFFESEDRVRDLELNYPVEEFPQFI